VLLGGGVDLAPGGAALDADRPRAGINVDGAQAPKVEAHSCVDHGGAGDAVPASVHRQRQVAVPGQGHHGHDIVDRAAPGDHRRAPVDHPVEHRSGLVVARVPGVDQRPREPVDRKLAVGHVRLLAPQASAGT
jgi:hypothetical protein